MEGPIFIAGCPRSGMTMTAGVVRRCGVDFGRSCGRLGDDSSGASRRLSYNHPKVSDQVITPYMQLLGVDPRGQLSFPDVSQLLPIANLRTKVETIFKFDGYKYGPWAIKDPRLLLTWPMWVEAFPDAHWIIVQREIPEIINSCLHTKYMNAHTTPEGWASWVHAYYTQVGALRKAARVSRVIWPTTFIDGDLGEIMGVLGGLGLKWNDAAVRSYLRPTSSSVTGGLTNGK